MGYSFSIVKRNEKWIEQRAGVSAASPRFRLRSLRPSLASSKKGPEKGSDQRREGPREHSGILWLLLFSSPYLSPAPIFLQPLPFSGRYISPALPFSGHYISPLHFSHLKPISFASSLIMEKCKTCGGSGKNGGFTCGVCQG